MPAERPRGESRGGRLPSRRSVPRRPVRPRAAPCGVPGPRSTRRASRRRRVRPPAWSRSRRPTISAPEALSRFPSARRRGSAPAGRRRRARGRRAASLRRRAGRGGGRSSPRARRIQEPPRPGRAAPREALRPGRAGGRRSRVPSSSGRGETTGRRSRSGRDGGATARRRGASPPPDPRSGRSRPSGGRDRRGARGGSTCPTPTGPSPRRTPPPRSRASPRGGRGRAGPRPPRSGKRPSARSTRLLGPRPRPLLHLVPVERRHDDVARGEPGEDLRPLRAPSGPTSTFAETSLPFERRRTFPPGRIA